MPVANAISVGDILEVKIVTLCQLQLAFNLLHYRVDAITPITGFCTDYDVAQAHQLAQASFYPGIIAPLAVGKGATCQIIRPTPHPFNFVASDSPSTETGDCMPKQVSGLVTKLTGGIGRSNRGRFYMPFPGEDDNGADDKPMAGYLAGLSTLANGWFSGPYTVIGVKGTAHVVPVVYHRATSTTTDITGWTIKARWATQRRRGDYGAINQLPWADIL